MSFNLTRKRKLDAVCARSHWPIGGQHYYLPWKQMRNNEFATISTRIQSHFNYYLGVRGIRRPYCVRLNGSSGAGVQGEHIFATHTSTSAESFPTGDFVCGHRHRHHIPISHSREGTYGAPMLILCNFTIVRMGNWWTQSSRGDTD